MADFCFSHIGCVPPGHPHRIQTRINTDDGARLKVRW
jgi:hypothetical protein